LHGLSDGVPVVRRTADSAGARAETEAKEEEEEEEEEEQQQQQHTDLMMRGQWWDWDFFYTRSDRPLSSAATATPDYALAYEYYKKAALQGNADGVNGLGYMHLHGLGVDKDWEKAVEFFERAAHDRSVDAIYNMGVVHLTPPQGPEPVELQVSRRANPKNSGAKRSAKQRKKEEKTKKTAPAGPRIGGFNFKKSIAHFRVAARSGHMLAMHKLAHMALHGLGMEKPNCAEAVKLFKGIAERGPQAELLALAERAYANNAKGAALFWYSVAADMGFELAQANAAHLFEDLPAHVLRRLSMLDAVVGDNGTAAVALAGKRSKSVGETASAAEPSEDAHDSRSTGGASGARGADGAGTSAAAAANGKDAADPAATARPAPAVASRPPFSLRMWKLAAKQQNVAANIRAGDMYFYGLQGIPVDFEQATAHYRVATTLGSPQAMFNLGWHYQYGVGLPVDFHLAKRYYDQAYETHPREANVPSKLAFLSLWLYSSWVSSSSWTVMYRAMRASVDGYMRAKKWELALGDIPDASAFSLGTRAPRLGRPPASLLALFAEEDSEMLRAIAGVALLLGLLLVRSWRRAAVA
jgi:TPR repeat protein